MPFKILSTWRFRNFSFYPSIASTPGLVRAYDSLKTEKRFKEKRRKKTDRKKKEENWRKKFRAISRLEKIEEILRNFEKIGERNLKKVLHGPKWSLETCRARTSYLENVYRGTVDDVG